MNEIEIITINVSNRRELFTEAYNGSYYTITGCGDEITEWIKAYADALEKDGIGTPSKFIIFKGADMNLYYGLTNDNAYKDDLTFLMFPLDGLDIPKLAMFKISNRDRWFDDIVANNAYYQNQIFDYE